MKARNQPTIRGFELHRSRLHPDPLSCAFRASAPDSGSSRLAQAQALIEQG